MFMLAELATLTLSAPAGAGLALGESQPGISSVVTEGALRSSRISSSKWHLALSPIDLASRGLALVPLSSLTINDLRLRFVSMVISPF